MSETEIAWAAGFFDGEGSIMFDPRKPPKYFRLRIPNTERVLLERFVAAMGRGKILDIKNQSPLARKPMYLIQYGARDDVRAVLELLMPYLGPRKRERGEQLLAHYPTEEEKRQRHSEAAKQRWVTRRANLARA